VSSSANGYQHTIIDPTLSDYHGKAHYSSCMHGQITREAAVQRARSHAAQWAWTAAFDDEAHIG
jgi:hypothetical protein